MLFTLEQNLLFCKLFALSSQAVYQMLLHLTAAIEPEFID
jgi:hypothetical protein